MAKDIEEYFIKRLQSYLLEYLQDFSQNNMAKVMSPLFQVFFGFIVQYCAQEFMHQKVSITKFQISIIHKRWENQLDYSQCKFHQFYCLKMPLNYKKQQPEMIIEGIDLHVCTIQEANQSAQNKDSQTQGIDNLKKHKLKLWEEQMAKYFEKLSPPNWIQKIVDGIYCQIKKLFLICKLTSGI